MTLEQALTLAAWGVLAAWLYLAAILRFVIWRNLTAAAVLAIYG